MTERAPKMTTREEFAAYLEYDPETGIFTWIAKAAAATLVGSRAGSVVNYGHRVIKIGRRGYMTSKLAWLFVHGEWPSFRLKALNGDKSDDRIANLAPMKGLEEKFETTTEGRAAYLLAHRARYHESYKDGWLQRKYGVSLDQYREMSERQSHCCAICGNPETGTRNGKTITLAVDHDHASGAVRELLCRGCNQLIGNAKEDPEILVAAIAYLRRHSPVTEPVSTDLVHGWKRRLDADGAVMH